MTIPTLARPRIFIDEQWVNRFANEVQAHQDLKGGWEQLISEADALLHEDFFPESYADGIASQHGRYNVPGEQIKKMGLTLGLAYQVTKQKTYANKLKEALLFYSEYDRWHGRGLADKHPPWHSELNTARFCFGFALGYDYIHGLLSDEEKAKIREAMITLGIIPTLRDWVWPETRVHAMDSMGHNWWIVCVSQAGLSILSILDDEPRASTWLAETLQAIPHYFSYAGSVLGNKSTNYDNKGAFYESVNYAQYAIYEYMLFRIAYSQMHQDFTTDDIPILEHTYDFFIQSFYPSSHRHLTVNFGDGHLYQPSTMGAKLFLAYGIDDPVLRWYVAQYEEPYDAYDIIFHDKIKLGAKQKPTDDKSEVYEDIGWAIFRDHWDEDATLLAVKAGFTWNHAHADAGSFMLFHQGLPLLIDSGNCSYGRSEYNAYYVQSEAHNVVLFNGQGQDREDIYRGGKEPGQLYNYLDGAGVQYVYADAAGPMGRFFKRNFRHFLWIDDCIVIIDDVMSYESGKIEWLLHYEGEMVASGDQQYVISNEEAKVLVHQLHPKHANYEVRTGLADHDPDREQPYAVFSPQEVTNEGKLMHAIIPLGNRTDHKAPELIPFSDDEMTGVSIISRDKRTDVYFNHRTDGRVMHENSYHVMQGWETDASILAITTPVGSDAADFAAIERVFVAGGSFLRRGENVLLSSLAKVTAAFTEEDDGTLEVALVGQPHIEAEIYCKQAPDKLIVNDVVSGINYNEKKQRVTMAVHTPRLTTRRPG